MVANNNLIETNRKLSKLHGVSSMSPNHTENCDLTKLNFCSLLNDIIEYQYFDVSFHHPTSSIYNIKNTISFLHINIRSLIQTRKLWCTVHEFFTLLPFTLNIVCVSETRFKGDPLINIAIPNYNFVHADSVANAGGVRRLCLVNVQESSKSRAKFDFKRLRRNG